MCTGGRAYGELRRGQDSRLDELNQVYSQSLHMYTAQLHIHMYTAQLHVHMYTAQLHVHMYTAQLHVHMYTAQLHIHMYTAQLHIHYACHCLGCAAYPPSVHD